MRIKISQFPRLLEQDMGMHAGGNIVRALGVKQRRRTDVLSKGLRIQKKYEFKIPTKLTIVEWMTLVPEKPGNGDERMLLLLRT
ncbi:hypothetical protein V6N13_124822 [Hibiscus sabdariffa]|uniref:Uncharacterized protein n=1 Tax=Hibiscus sabdariffa TaxID=183260 RepID=A0ABR2U4B2_9ROSI